MTTEPTTTPKPRRRRLQFDRRRAPSLRGVLCALLIAGVAALVIARARSAFESGARWIETRISPTIEEGIKRVKMAIRP